MNCTALSQNLLLFTLLLCVQAPRNVKRGSHRHPEEPAGSGGRGIMMNFCACWESHLTSHQSRSRRKLLMMAESKFLYRHSLCRPVLFSLKKIVRGKRTHDKAMFTRVALAQHSLTLWTCEVRAYLASLLSPTLDIHATSDCCEAAFLHRITRYKIIEAHTK